MFACFKVARSTIDDAEVEINDILGEGDFYRKNLKRVRDYIHGTIPIDLPDEFKSRFRMTSERRHEKRRHEQEWSNGTEFSGYSDFPERGCTRNVFLNFRKLFA